MFLHNVQKNPIDPTLKFKVLKILKVLKALKALKVLKVLKVLAILAILLLVIINLPPHLCLCTYETHSSQTNLSQQIICLICGILC